MKQEYISRCLPIPDSPACVLPANGTAGSFWEPRGDRRHAGVDLYAPAGTPVAAIENGIVIEKSVFTSPQLISYWNITYSILIQSESGIVFRYAEMGEVFVSTGDSVLAGQIIGNVGMVLASERISETAPLYIQRLKERGLPSMLHFEMHTAIPTTDHYLGGNYFSEQKPATLLDPTHYLEELFKKASESGATNRNL